MSQGEPPGETAGLPALSQLAMAPGHGHAHALTTAGGLRLELVHVPADHRMRGHGHEQLHLCAVLDGAFRERARRGGDELCAPGVVRLSPPESRHDLAFGPAGTVCLLVHAPAELVPPDAGGLDAARDVFLRDDRHLTAVAGALGRALVRRLAHDGPDTDAGLALDGHAFELLAQCGRRLGRATPLHDGPPGWLRRAREQLHDRLTAPPSLAELAREAGVHRAHLARAFRDHFGLTAGDYVRAARAERARALIVRTRAPLSRVAAEVGFADQSHMTREMRRAYGESPGELRRLLAR